MIRSSEIKGFALNPEYFIKEDLETLIKIYIYRRKQMKPLFHEEKYEDRE